MYCFTKLLSQSVIIRAFCSEVLSLLLELDTTITWLRRKMYKNGNFSDCPYCLKIKIEEIEK